MLASTLIALSAGLPAVLGLFHLAFTFLGSKLHPRDSKLRSEMENTPLVLTKETTMWKAWIGFNASHSLGLLLFGATYGYLALAQSQLLVRSGFLLVTGFLTLTAYVCLAQRYWFSRPFRFALLSWALYLAGVLAGLRL